MKSDTVKKTKEPSQLLFEIRPTMDLCNLYISNIPSSMSSIDLFNAFNEYGRIISAKMMEEGDKKDAQKRYGFVSYSNSIETAKALIEMSGKTLTVRFHEPKIPRQEHNFSQQLQVLSSSSLAKYFYRRENNKKVRLSREGRTASLFSYGPSAYAYYPPYWRGDQGTTYSHQLPVDKAPLVQGIIQSMKSEKRIPEELESALLHELYRLDYTELLLCSKDTKYCYDKLSHVSLSFFCECSDK